MEYRHLLIKMCCSTHQGASIGVRTEKISNSKIHGLKPTETVSAAGILWIFAVLMAQTTGLWLITASSRWHGKMQGQKSKAINQATKRPSIKPQKGNQSCHSHYHRLTDYRDMEKCSVAAAAAVTVAIINIHINSKSGWWVLPGKVLRGARAWSNYLLQHPMR